MSSTGPGSSQTTAKAPQGDAGSPSGVGSASMTALPTAPIAIPGPLPRSEPIPIVPGFQATRSQSRPMASSAPGRFNLNQNEELDILGSSPPDKNKRKFFKW